MIGKQFTDSVNYLAGLDHSYGKAFSLVKNNISMQTGKVYSCTATLNLYDDTDKLIHPVVLADDTVTLATIEAFIASIKTTIEASYPTVTVESSAVGALQLITIKVAGATDDTRYLINGFTLEIKIDGSQLYTVDADILNPYNVIPSLVMNMDTMVTSGMAITNNIADIQSVIDNIDVVNTVALNSIDVNLVAGSIANVHAVGENLLDVGVVSNNILDVNIAADNIASINTVANDLALGVDSNIVITSTGMDNVTIVATNIDGTISADIPLVANRITNGDLDKALTNIDHYNATNLGPLAIEPTILTHPLLSVGDYYFNTVTLQEHYYDGVIWNTRQYTDSAINTFTNKTIDSITNSVGANHMYYKVRNESGSTIPRGTVITATATQPGTDYLEVEPIADTTTQIALGITRADMPTNSIGLTTNSGLTEDYVNTSAWAEGTILYPSNGGGLTNVQPTSGAYQACALVMRSHVTQGRLLIRFSNPIYIASTTQSGYVQLNNTLTSTSTTKALTAAQGKALQDTKVDENAPITAGTATKITYDTKGLVTVGGMLSAEDLPNIDASKVTTGTLGVARGGTGATTSTGTGSVVLNTAPTLVTPNIGVATGSSFNAITALAATPSPMDGVAGTGVSTTVARQDHVHPSDVSKANDSAVVKLTGNQTKAGVLNLTSSPIVPVPTLNFQPTVARSTGIVVRVPEDYETINLALKYLSGFRHLYVKNGVRCEVSLANGYVIAEQIFVNGIDLSYITLTSRSTTGAGYENGKHLVDRAALTTEFSVADYGITSYPVIGAKKDGKSPVLSFVLDCQVVLGSETAADLKHGLFAIGGGSISCTHTAGAIQCSGHAAFTRAGGTISAENMTNSSNTGFAAYARAGGTISAENMTNSSDSSFAAHARAGGTISAENMTNSSNSSFAAYAQEGTISASTMTNSSNSSFAAYAQEGTISASTMTNSSNSYHAAYAQAGTISAYAMTNSSNSYHAAYARAGTISAYVMTNSSNTGFAAHARAGGTISAENMTNSSNSSYAAHARAGTISAYVMVCSNTTASTVELVRILAGGIITNDAGVWTNLGTGAKCNVAAGTISANGYINRIG